MTRPPAPPTEPRHARGGAGGAGRGQWVRYPLRVVVDTVAYADADTKVYGKVAALACRRECEASVEKLAQFTGLSVSAVEKALGRLSRPAPTDGVAELTRRQRAHRTTGKGRTNARTCRELDEGERYVWAPVRAADGLRGTLHRLYLIVRYTVLVERRELTLAELGQMLAHHGGKHAGQALHEGTMARLLDDLEDAGWITQDKRAGYRGRHALTVHDDPVHPAGEPGPTPLPGGPGHGPTPDAECGAGPDAECGAPAYKEDEQLTDSGMTEPGGGARRRRGDREWVSPPVDTGGNRNGREEITAKAASPRPYDGPPLTLSPRIWHILEPVRDMLGGLSPYLTRRIAREIGHQLDTYATPQRLTARLTARRAAVMNDDIHDTGRWLLGVALPRWGCGHTDCETGVLWTTGRPCPICTHTIAQRARGHPPPPHTPLPDTA